MSYIIISKTERLDSNKNVGKIVLMSFASKAIWKAFYWLNIQGDALPNCYDKKTALYALNKYANKEDYELMEHSEAIKELNKFLNK